VEMPGNSGLRTAITTLNAFLSFDSRQATDDRERLGCDTNYGMELLGRNDSFYHEGPEEFGEESALQGFKDFMVIPTSVLVKMIGNLLRRTPCGRDNGCLMTRPAADNRSMTRIEDALDLCEGRCNYS
jgi:hypothetical protein